MLGEYTYDLFCEILKLHKQIILSSLEKQFPHFEIEGFVDVKQKEQMYEYSQNDHVSREFQKYYKSVNMIVFDTTKQMKKMLVIYILCFLKENELSLVKSTIKNLNQTDHLILQCYDSYYLRDFANIQSYFVVEMEYCDLPLVSFINKDDISDDIFFNLLSSFQTYLQDKYTIDEDIFRYEWVEFFVNTMDKNKICVKLNLLSLKSYVERQLYSKEQNENEKIKQNRIQTMENEIDESIDCIDEEDSQKIQKQDLVSEIKESYSYLIEKYSLDLYENISQHPQYQSYQINAEIDGCLNLTILNKQDKQIFLQVYKMKSFQEAQLFANLMERCALSNQSIKFNIINVNVIPCEKVCYVLLEKSKIKNCTTIQEMEIEKAEKYSYQSYYQHDQETEQLRKTFIQQSNLINLSQDLLVEKNIQITKINPNNILVDKEVIQNSKVFQYAFDQFKFQEDFEYIYQNKVKQAFEVFKQKYHAADKYPNSISQIVSYNLISEYFKAISLISTEKASSLYLLIQQCLKTLEMVLYSKQHQNLKVFNEQNNSLELIINSNNILHFKNLNQFIMDQYQYQEKIINLQKEIINLHKTIIQEALQRLYPHFQIEGFVDVKEIPYLEDYYDDDDDYEIYDQFLTEFKNYCKKYNMVVFDKNKQIKKMLIIYNQSFYKENEINVIKSAIQTLKQAEPLVLYCYDSYQLSDSSDRYRYFVAEMEYCDIPLLKFTNTYDISEDQIQSLSSTFQKYFLDQYIIDNQNQVEYCIKILNPNQISVKINLLSLSSYMEKQLDSEQNHENKDDDFSFEDSDSYDDDFYQIKNNCLKSFVNSFGKEINDSYEDYYQIKNNCLKSFIKSFGKEIKKQDLVKEIQDSYSYLLNNYSLDFFENISYHPQYQSYQIKAQMNGSLNLTAINKEDKQIILQVFKMSSFQEVQQNTEKIQKIANMKKNIQFNILNVDCPHFQIEGFIDVKERTDIDEIDSCDVIEVFVEEYNSLNIIVFDLNKQIQKMLAVYITDLMKESQLSQIKSAIKTLQQTNHLILQCYDSYYLSDLSDKQIYFAIEMEFCDMPLLQFRQKCRISNDQIIFLLSSFQKYLSNQYILDSKTINEYTLSSQGIELFVKNISQNQIHVKLHLLSLKSSVEKQLLEKIEIQKNTLVEIGPKKKKRLRLGFKRLVLQVSQQFKQRYIKIRPCQGNKRILCSSSQEVLSISF
ncbi:hypothetical protein ABPG72_006442 [Tetrahymena utriculariae]